MSFSAYSTIKSSTQGQTIVFEHETIDVGNGYDPSTGIYTAPRTGRYVFTYTVGQNGGASNNNYWLMLNNVTTPVDQMWLYGSFGSVGGGSQTAMVTLTKGDQVFVKIQRQQGNANLYCRKGSGNNGCTFSAFMLN